jgi:hypothetical protein
MFKIIQENYLNIPYSLNYIISTYHIYFMIITIRCKPGACTTIELLVYNMVLIHMHCRVFINILHLFSQNDKDSEGDK